MNKLLNAIGKALRAVLIMLVLMLLALFVYNKVQTRREAVIFENPIGQFVDIDGHKMCVYTEGEGEHTLVFLSGSGTASPILDFKSIYSRLSDEYRIVVIEKFGYGFSDVSGTERDFDTILRQDREALSRLGIQGPFILCPHSMSGLEAIMWTQRYPEEVEAIVGLDMATPEDYEGMEMSGFAIKSVYAINTAAREFGILRFLSDEDLMTSQVLSQEERALYRKILYAKLLNDDVKSEGNYTDAACDEIRGEDYPDVPMLLFVSDGSGGTGSSKETWRGFAHEFASRCPDAQIVELDCPHYVHNFETDRIEEDMRAFIEADSTREQDDTDQKALTQKDMSLEEYLQTTDEQWFLTGKTEYTVQAMMVSEELSFHNDFEEADYTATDDGDTVVLKGTRDEMWTTPFSKVAETYTKPDGSKISEADFAEKDVFIDIVTIPTPDAYYALHVPNDVSVTVETAWGDVLHTNLPNAPHGEGDYLACRVAAAGEPDLSDVWVINGIVFPDCYDTSHMHE